MICYQKQTMQASNGDCTLSDSGGQQVKLVLKLLLKNTDHIFAMQATCSKSPGVGTLLSK